MMQKVGTQALLCVIAISGFVLLVGLVFLLFARFTKPEDEVIRESDQETIPENETAVSEKEIMPETIEEIEEQEKLAKKE